MINHYKLKRGTYIPLMYHNSLIKSPNAPIYLPPSWHKFKNCFMAQNALAFLTNCELQFLLISAKIATSHVTWWFLQNHCLHSCRIHICPSCSGPTGANTITDVAVNIFKRLAPFSDVALSLCHHHTPLEIGSVFRLRIHCAQYKALSRHQHLHSTDFPMLLPLDIRGPNSWVMPQLHKQQKKA